jgi:bifunctional non-homologous end joining protein LigD
MIPLTKIFTPNKYKNKFLIHLHRADRVGLHYDLRIEHNGTLISWATRHLPDLLQKKRSKILLIKQSDHNLEWFDFQGEITDGYGKGKVQIWDKGIVNKIRWSDVHMKVAFSGTKIKGVYHILKYQETKDNHFLMFQSKDQ